MAAPELLVLALGLFLRLRLATTYDPSWGYDFESHRAYIAYVDQHHALPPLQFFRTSYHPPLYYWIAGFAERHGAQLSGLQWISITAGCLRLIFLAWALRRFLPESRLARTVALALAGVLPAGLLVDGMISNEALSVLLSTVAIALVAETFRSTGRPRVALAAVLGLVLGAAMLTKVSSMVVVLGVAIGLPIEALASRESFATRFRHALPLAASILLALLIAIPVYARHFRATGHIIATGGDTTPYEKQRAKSVEGKAYSSCRPIGYFVGLGDAKILAEPYWPNGTKPPRFWPVLLGSTFADYYCAFFSGMPDVGERWVSVNDRILGSRALALMRASFAAGLPISIASLVALLATVAVLRRRRDLGRSMPLLVSVLAVCGQLYFAVAYPFDDQGVVKGAYLQFAAAPLFAVFGAATAWCWRRRFMRWVAVAQIAALLTVGVYSLHARRVLLRIGPPTALPTVVPDVHFPLLGSPVIR